MKHLLVNETFTSIKGEGLDVGKRAFFIRFYRCNLNCEWCDTNYARHGGEVKPYSAEDLLSITPSKIPLVLTGGEPLLQDLWPFLQMYFRREGRGCSVEIETNGTIFSDYKYVQFTVSPTCKILSS
jgi:7-carboxy-7-deazaguanine synthase